jgi:hypothetical protein
MILHSKRLLFARLHEFKPKSSSMQANYICGDFVLIRIPERKTPAHGAEIILLEALKITM